MKLLQAIIPEPEPGLKRIILYACSGVPEILALLIGCFFRVLFGKRWVISFGVVWVELGDNWFTRGPYKHWGGSTFGHVVVVAPGYLQWADEPIEDWVKAVGKPIESLQDVRLWYLARSLYLAAHELVHVEVYEVLAVLNTVGVVWHTLMSHSSGFEAAMIQWFLGGVAAFGTAIVVAKLRGEANGYRGSTFEEAAYNRVSCYRNAG